MAEAVETTIRDGEVLFVQAGTGTGKSLAYGAGAVAAHRKTVVSTSSIALQDQLLKKDLPIVAAQLKTRNFKYALLKGRSNYLCRQSLEDLCNEGAGPVQTRLLEVPELEKEGVEPKQLRDIADWATTTDTGDKAELPFEPSWQTWSALSRTSETCPGRKKCAFGETCFTEQARDRAKDADVLVVNTHLYALNVAAEGAILPSHEVVVFDEAHAVEEILSSALGSELGGTHVRALANDVKRILQDDRTTGQLEAAALELATAITEVSHPHGDDKPPEDLRLIGGAGAIDRLKSALDQTANAVNLVAMKLSQIPDSTPKANSRRDRARLTAKAVMARIGAVSTEDKKTVVWLEGGRYIKTAPVNVGKVLKNWFWTAIGEDLPPEDFHEDDEEDDGQKQARPPRSVVFTSATIPSTLGERLFAPDPKHLDVGSPFDFRTNALLYVPRIPDPKTDASAWKKAAHEEMRDLITAAGGRTLALFTSVSAMNEAYEALSPTLPYRLLVQGGDLPKRRLVEEFTRDHATCLFATRSFFQGVDVPGETLSLVILDRIPFPRPGEPLIEAWQDEAGGGWQGFAAVCIPIAGTTLAQASGRLIRTANDRGVVAVLDSRLAEKSYRTKLLSSVPPMRRLRDKAEVLAFLSEISAPAVAKAG